MTPESQRIAIAEACGYKFWHCPGDETLLLRPNERWPAQPYWKKRGFVQGDGRPDGPIVDLTGLPDYLNSLDAMHEAEKVLDREQIHKFVDELEHLVVQQQKFLPTVTWLNWLCIHATAAQRAEAFLRTLGLWKDDALHLSTVNSTTASINKK